MEWLERCRVSFRSWRRINRMAAVFGVTLALIAAGAYAYVFHLAPSGTQLPPSLPPTPPAPYRDSCTQALVVLGTPAPAPNGTAVVLAVTEAVPRCALGGFSALILLENVSEGEIDPLADGGSSGLLSFTDSDHDANLTAGDRFFVLPDDGINHTLRVRLGTVPAGMQAWQVPPSIALGELSPVPLGFVLNVSSMGPKAPLGGFRASLSKDSSSAGYLRCLRDGARDRNLSFTDADGSGTLTTGDRFTVDDTGPGRYALEVWWLRDEKLAARSWNVSLPPGGPVITLVWGGGGRSDPQGPRIQSIDRDLPLTDFRAVLAQNGTPIGELNPVHPGIGGYLRFFQGATGALNLSVGDTFNWLCTPDEVEFPAIGCPLPRGGPDPACPCEFRLYWQGILVATWSWGG